MRWRTASSSRCRTRARRWRSFRPPTCRAISRPSSRPTSARWRRSCSTPPPATSRPPASRPSPRSADALDGRVLSRDALHEELRGRLPAELLPWCKGCQSHHARRGLLTVAALAGRLCFAGREGRQPAFARTDQWTALAPAEPRAAKAEFVRRYLRHLGPSKPADLAAWAGIAPSHARALWETVEDELVEVGRTSMLADDARTEPPPAKGVRLLGPGDPLLIARDREQLLPKQLHKQLWRPVGSPGLVLNDGRPAGFWRARKQGRKLRFETEWFGKAVDIGAEAERLAAARGLEAA